MRKHLDWKLGLSNDCKEREGPVPFLPPRAAAWIILLHDLTWIWKPDRITKNLVVEFCAALSKKKCRNCPTLETPGWAWKKNRCGSWVHFPLPSLTTFRQLDRFLAVWNDVLRSNAEDLSLAQLARHWDFAKGIVEDPEDRYDKFARGELKMPKNGQEDSTGIEEQQ